MRLLLTILLLFDFLLAQQIYTRGKYHVNTGGGGGIGNVESAESEIVYDEGNYPADGSWHTYRVYAYVGDPKEYSAVPAQTEKLQDNGTYDPDPDAPKYKITVTWSAVSGADGYRILLWYETGFQDYGITGGCEWTYHADVTSGTTLEDTDYTIWESGGL